MFVYYYRLRDRYQQQIASLAILGDERATWRPQPVQDELWGCAVSFRFPIIKLLDYETQWAELETSTNPFAIAVMAHLKTKDTRHDAVTRKEWKFRLTRRLYEQGYERQDILNLFRFLDWLMELPEGLKQLFWADLEQYEQEQKMPYVTSIEQIGIKQGIEKGIKQGIEQGREQGREQERRSVALKMLKKNLPLELVAEVTELTIAQLQQLQADAAAESQHDT